MQRFVWVFAAAAGSEDAVQGLARRSLIRLELFADPAAPHIDLLLYVTKAARGPVPVYLGLNYLGLGSVEADPDLPMTPKFVISNPEKGVVQNRVTEKTRGAHASRWPLELALRRGYAVAQPDEWGASLGRRDFGETIALSIYHAPRPVYIASASEDLGADPKGEFLAAWHAGPAYALYGWRGLEQEQMPPAEKPLGLGPKQLTTGSSSSTLQTNIYRAISVFLGLTSFSDSLN